MYRFQEFRPCWYWWISICLFYNHILTHMTHLQVSSVVKPILKKYIYIQNMKNLILVNLLWIKIMFIFPLCNMSETTKSNFTSRFLKYEANLQITEIVNSKNHNTEQAKIWQLMMSCFSRYLIGPWYIYCSIWLAVM